MCFFRHFLSKKKLLSCPTLVYDIIFSLQQRQQSQVILDSPCQNNSSTAEEELNESSFYSLEQEVSFLSSYLLPTHKKKSYLPYWFKIFHIRSEEILSAITFFRMDIYLSVLIFLVSSPPSTNTLRFPLSSWMKTILSKFSKFLMSSTSIPSSSSLTITIFSKGLCYSTKTWLFLKMKLEN